MESDAKFEVKQTLGSKNDLKNLVNFNGSSGKSEDFHSDVLLFSKVYYVWAKKYRGVMCHNTEEFGEFWPNSRKSQKLHFSELLLTKARVKSEGWRVKS